jgi:hypothetical protein
MLWKEHELLQCFLHTSEQYVYYIYLRAQDYQHAHVICALFLPLQMHVS